jgi:2-dehydro-3-deoxygluconokinase
VNPWLRPIAPPIILGSNRYTGDMTPIAPAGTTVVAHGEVLLRLKSPGFERLLQSPRLEVCVGGAEMNVLASLARFGRETRLVTTLPDHALGDEALAELRALGIGTTAIHRRPGRMGLYFIESGHGSRATQVIYDRAGSSFALDDSARSWADLLKDAALLHLTGITPALSVSAAAGNLLAAQQAHRLGVQVSVDVNFRAQLWAVAPQPREVALAPLLQLAHVLFAGAGDIAAGLGLASDSHVGSPAEEFERLSAIALERLPGLQVICTCLRSGTHAERVNLTAVGRTRQEFHRSVDREVHFIVDRIGTGDAFAAGVLHRHLGGESIGRSLEFGLAAAALKHGVPGDVNRVSEAEVNACLTGTSAALIRR